MTPTICGAPTVYASVAATPRPSTRLCLRRALKARSRGVADEADPAWPRERYAAAAARADRWLKERFSAGTDWVKHPRWLHRRALLQALAASIVGVCVLFLAAAAVVFWSYTHDLRAPDEAIAATAMGTSAAYDRIGEIKLYQYADPLGGVAQAGPPRADLAVPRCGYGGDGFLGAFPDMPASGTLLREVGNRGVVQNCRG